MGVRTSDPIFPVVHADPSWRLIRSNVRLSDWAAAGALTAIGAAVGFVAGALGCCAAGIARLFFCSVQ